MRSKDGNWVYTNPEVAEAPQPREHRKRVSAAKLAQKPGRQPCSTFLRKGGATASRMLEKGVYSMFARRLGMFLPLVLLAASTALGQTTFATITGLITDSQGTLVPGATILAIHQRTNYRYSGASNDA